MSTTSMAIFSNLLFASYSVYARNAFEYTAASHKAPPTGKASQPRHTMVTGAQPLRNNALSHANAGCTYKVGR